MSSQSLTELLKGTEIFSELPVEVLNELSRHVSVHRVKQDVAIIHKGEEGHSMYIIADGTVRIHDKEHVVATMSKGNFFGEFSLLDAAPRSMSVSANTDAELIGINRESFFDVLQHHPDLTKKIIAQLTKRMRGQNNVIISQLKSKEEELSRLVEIRTAEVVHQKEIVEIKNKEILDSIHYAKRLQEAILPTDKTVKTYFPESFVLYMPKDIVAGDFYWIATSGEIVLVAVADCTGHGVSGALMSMMGVSLLNQIVNEKGIIVPSEILNQLHHSVIMALKQTENDTNDGMDIAICSFDLKNKQFQFAGANRPLWVIKNNEIEIIVPDKIPVGGLQIEGSGIFTNHAVKLNANETFYLFTDGYADQFGGENGKKLMTKQFKEKLLAVKNLNLTEQMKALKEYFEKWKGSNEQVDDVLVMGIRI
ncbi:MAG: PP2C family protein-serine/threonine phosphatase [Bacteroidia bacterium]